MSAATSSVGRRVEPRTLPPGVRRKRFLMSVGNHAILIAIGAFIPTLTDSLNRFGSTDLFQLGKFLGVVFLFLGFLVSIEVFREFRIPFTGIRLANSRRESPAAVREPRTG